MVKAQALPIMPRTVAKLGSSRTMTSASPTYSFHFQFQYMIWGEKRSKCQKYDKSSESTDLLEVCEGYMPWPKSAVLIKNLCDQSWGCSLAYNDSYVRQACMVPLGTCAICAICTICFMCHMNNMFHVICFMCHMHNMFHVICFMCHMHNMFHVPVRIPSRRSSVFIQVNKTTTLITLSRWSLTNPKK